MSAVALQGIAAGLRRELTGRRLALVCGICFLLSTQLLFQRGIFQYDVVDVLQSFAEYFLEVTAVGLSVFVAVIAIYQVFPEAGLARSTALACGVLAGVCAGVAAGTLVRYGEGPYPPMLFIAGEVVRWTIVAGVIALIHELQRRDEKSARDLHRLDLERLAFEQRRMEARVQLMQAQIEPHFLFNTLATLKRLYRTEPSGGARMLDSLIEYLRAALPRLREEDTTLGDELDLAAAYLEILRVRMGDRLRYSVDAPAAARAIPFPSMMLITLVENAIKHGISPKPEGGAIEIRARLERSRLVLDVSDTGVGFRAASGSGIGLANTRARLDAVFGPEGTLVLEANEPSGVVARIDVPLDLRSAAR